MDVDEEGCLPEPDIQVGDSEAISEEPTLQSDSDETDDDAGDGSDSDGTSEGSLMDSDSGDEFESDEEGVGDQEDGVWNHRGPLEFELRAAEAGSVLCRAWDLDERLMESSNL